MKRLIVMALLLLSVDCFAGGVLGVANPAKVAGVTTPDKICGVAGLAASGATDYTQDANAMGAWYMNLGAGTAETDRTANGNNLAVSASDEIPRSSTVPTGYSGYSRDFERSEDDSMSIADGTELDINGADQPLTVAAWIKVESVDANDDGNQGIISKSGPAGYRQYILFIDYAAAGTFVLKGNISNDGTAATLAETSTTYSTGTWYHVAMVYNDTDIRLYVDGELAVAAVACTTGIFNAESTFKLGGFTESYGTFDGLIDEPLVLNRAASATEVANMAADGISGNKGGSD